MKVSIGVICAVVFVGFGPTASAHADICGDLNPPVDTNGTFVDACGVNFDTLYDGDLFARPDTDFHGFNITAPTRLTVALQDQSSPPECVNGWLYNAAATFLASGSNCGNGGQPPTKFSFDVPAAGAYYLQIGQPAPAPATRNRYQFQLTGTGAPAVPTNVYATPVNATTIHVEWVANSADATRFDVEGNGTARSAMSSPYDWTGLTGGTKVCFRVRAVNAIGPSGYYPVVTPSDICATTPDAATGSTGSSGGLPPTAATAKPPPPPPANLPPPPPPGTVIVVPGAPSTPGTTTPATPAQPGTRQGPSRRCRTARADVRRLKRVVSSDRDRLDAASTRRRRNKIQNKLDAPKQTLAKAKRRQRRQC
jgi:hypothetical protein